MHTGLDVAGFVPGLGAAPDLINAGLYLAQGDRKNAALSAAAAVPLAGDAVKAGAIGYKATKQALAHGDDVVAAGKAVAKKADNVAPSGATVESAHRESTGVDLALKHKSGWTEAQRAEAAAKARLLNDADTVVTKSERSGTAAAMKRYRRAERVPVARDVDHKVDLQLGGAKTTDNLWSLDSSVNRSLGAQVHHQTKHLPPGTPVNRVTIGD